METVIDVYDARRALRLIDYSIKMGAWYKEYAQRLREKLRAARYIVVKRDGIGAGVNPPPYFYVASLYGIDPLQWLLDRNPLIGVDILGSGAKIREELVEFKAALVYHGGRWRAVKPRLVAKLYTSRPEEVARVREEFLNTEAAGAGLHASGFNIKYPARVSWDKGYVYLDVKPLWATDEPPEEIEFEKVTLHVFDIEVLPDDTIIVSVLRHRLLTEPSRDDIEVVVCKGRDACDELPEAFKDATILYGHNIEGFDIPHLLRRWFIPRLALASRLDATRILANHGTSFQIGASKSLYAVAWKLRKAAGITDEELWLKESAPRILSSGNLEEVIKYNMNDVVITAKLANIIASFVILASAVAGIPPSVVQDVRAGIVAEYVAFRALEYRGVLLGYRLLDAKLSGSKVLVPCAVPQEGATLYDYLHNYIKR